MKKLVIGITVAALAVACSKKDSGTCATYAEMELKCQDLGSDDVDQVRSMAKSFCQKALDGDDMLNIADEVECSKKHKDCAAYLQCTGDALEE